jgi:serine protease Do
MFNENENSQREFEETEVNSYQDDQRDATNEGTDYDEELNHLNKDINGPFVDNPINVYSQSRFDESTKVRNSKKLNLKGFSSMIAAGVIGSILTLTIAPYTGIYKTNEKMVENKAVENDTNSSNIIATPTSATPTTNSLADIVENASKSIVGIVNKQQQNNFFSGSSETVESGSGSGVIFRKTADSAFIVTNNHVIEGASEVEISLYNGEKASAKLVGADALSDIAVLKIDPKYATHVIEFGDSSTLRPGDQVLAIGNPLGLDLSRTVTQGIVSAIDRSISVSTTAGEWDLNVIQTDAAINPGNSGGALINTLGQVIGINSLKIRESGVEGLGFAIPSNDLLPIVNQMIESGKIERPYMGVSLANLEEVPPMYLPELPEDVQEGVMVTYIDEGSSAEKAGILKQDVIVSINDQKIKSASDLRKYLYSSTKVGDQIKVKLYRQGEMTEVQMKLTSNAQ